MSWLRAYSGPLAQAVLAGVLIPRVVDTTPEYWIGQSAVNVLLWALCWFVRAGGR